MATPSMMECQGSRAHHLFSQRLNWEHRILTISLSSLRIWMSRNLSSMPTSWDSTFWTAPTTATVKRRIMLGTKTRQITKITNSNNLNKTSSHSLAICIRQNSAKRKRWTLRGNPCRESTCLSRSRTLHSKARKTRRMSTGCAETPRRLTSSISLRGVGQVAISFTRRWTMCGVF